MPKVNRKSERRGGFYWENGEPFVTVTTVLNVIDKSALRYWFGKQVYLAMVKNPGLGEQEALNAPNLVSDSAKNRGTAIHSIVEAYKHSKEYLDSVPELYRGHAKAFYKWMEDSNIEILRNEKTVISKKYGYAGTLDLLVKSGNSGRTYIVDIKTGKDIYPEAYIQLSAYKQALEEEGIAVDGLAVLLLRDTGNYKLGQGEDCFPVFLAAKQIWEWKNAELVNSIKPSKPKLPAIAT